MLQMELTVQTWLVVLLLSVAVTLLIWLMYYCVWAIVSSVRQVGENQAYTRTVKRQAQEIRAIGRSARQNMQELYDDYLTQVTQSRRR